jgi:hypothetical protein
MRWPSGQAVPALVESDKAMGGEVAREAIPVVSVGAQAMKQKHGSIAPRAGFRAPIEVMKADAASLEPSVGRFGHRP